MSRGGSASLIGYVSRGGSLEYGADDLGIVRGGDLGT